MRDFVQKAFSGLASKIGIVSLMAICFALFSVHANAQTTLVNYDFNVANACTAAPTTTATNITSTFGVLNGNCTTTTSGNAATTVPPAFVVNAAGSAPSINSTAAPIYQFTLGGSSLNTYTDYKVFFQLRSTSTGPNSGTLEYSVNGGAFVAALGSPFTIVNDSTVDDYLFDLSSITALDNATSITFRITGSGGNATTGALRVDNFQVQATAAPATTAPTITSANSTTFTQGTAGSFTVTTTGSPTPTLSFTGTLPSGVTFTNNGNGTATIAGTPTASGSFPLTITASNGTAPDATQNFTLTVNAAPPSGGTTLIVTPNNTQGFASSDTRPGGAVNFVIDPLAPAGVGALQLTTDNTTAAKADYFHATNTPLASVTDLSYYTKQNVGSPATADAAYQLPSFLNGTTGFSTLVFEPYLNSGINGNPVLTPGVFQMYDVDAGLFYSTRTVICTDSLGNTTGTLIGGSGANLYSLNDIKTACPQAVVLGFGVNIGTFNANYNVEVDLLNFNGTVYNFEPVVITAAGVNLSGRVATESGRGIMRATVMLTGGSLESPVYTTTDFEGNYNFNDIPAGETYVLSVVVKGYKFNQTSILVNLNEDYDKANFIGTPKQRIGTIK